MEIIFNKVINNRLLYHSLIWLVAICLIFAALLSDDTSILVKIKDLITILLPSITMTYVLFFIQDKLVIRKKYGLFILFIIPIVILFGLGAAFFSQFLNGEESELDRSQWIQNMLIMAFIVIVSRMAKNGIISQLHLKEVKVQKLQLELDYLKAQINPHFIFNTINNICGVNQIEPQKGTEMLICLGDLFRYHLEYSSFDRIPLKEEVQLIESYIALEKMRLRPNCSVNFNCKSENDEGEIAPLILLPFIENAFKHGVDGVRDCFINIDIDYSKDRINFVVSNTDFNKKEDRNIKIGQQNTIKRLEHIYKNSYDLVIQSIGRCYTVNLTLKL
jgi:LytS/YehU family sensor histidine kinase